jgi:hypothetical protein
MEIPTNGEREYFRAFGIVALFVAASTSRMPTLIGYTRDLGRSLESIRSRWHWSVDLVYAWWLADEAKAKAIIAMLNAALPVDAHGRFDAHADAVAGKIGAAARALDVTLTQHADAMRRVQLAVAKVDSVIDAANVTGDLGWFNRAYRQWRTTAPEDAAMALPYPLARSRLRAAVVRRIACGDVSPLSADLLSEVLPAIEGKPVPAAATPMRKRMRGLAQ